MLILIICKILLCLVSYTCAQPSFIASVCQDIIGNYTANSTFQNNLNTFFSTISSDTKIDYGFYNISVGKNLDIVNGIGLCRPDLSPAACRSCLSVGARAIVIDCPAQRDAIGWYDNCMIRYSDRYIFRKEELGPWYPLNSSVLVENIDKRRYNQTVSALLAKLQVKAASGDSRWKYAAGVANVTGSFTIYALVQCTPDLEYFDCYDCLGNAIRTALAEYYGQQARIAFTSCNIRYENYVFYDLPALNSLDSSRNVPPPSLATAPPISVTWQQKGKHRKKRVLIEIIVPIATSSLLLATLLGCYFFRRRSNAHNKKDTFFEAGSKVVRKPKALEMNFETIRAATGNFSSDNKIGQGGFGTVYKGTLLNGQSIAVKRLSRNSGQGEEEFKNEAVLVARLQHRNLVRFLGFCLEGDERLLIYELLPNKSLDYFLFDPEKRVHLDWPVRFKVIGGIARGLLYLHEDSRLLVVHRDLKAGNILLDAELNPKIADFGMAKLFGVDQTGGDTNKICGTYGYMPPEYVHHGHFSFKSDVFSYGVLLLEIISGLRINSFYNSETGETLLSFAWRNWLEGTPLNIVDSTMLAIDNAEVLRCIKIGLLCVQEDIAHRPIMSSVVLLLNSNTVIPLVPSRPAFLLDQSNSKASTPDTQVLAFSANEVSISELEPR